MPSGEAAAKDRPRTVYVDDELWKKLRMQAIEENTTAAGLVRKFIEQGLNGKRGPK